MSTTYSHPWSIPIITWLSQFGSVTANTLLVKTIWRFNRELSHSALPCHYVIRVASIAVIPPWSWSNTFFFLFFFFFFWGGGGGGGGGGAERVNRTAPDWHHLLGDNIVGHVVFKNWIAIAHCPFQLKMALSTQLWYIRLVCLLMGSSTW